MTSINQMTHDWAQKKSLQSTYLLEMTSTSDVAKLQWKNSEEFHLFLADHQSAGRGRGSSQWSNLSGGEVLLSTWCFFLKQPPQPILTPRIGLALFKSLKSCFPQVSFSLKAPNDILVEQKKLSGLLIEVIQSGEEYRLFVGLGMNAFRSPTVDQPTCCLADYVELNPASWNLFCETLLSSWYRLIPLASQNTLSPTECAALDLALNAGNPSAERFKIHPNGDLKIDHELIPWTSL